MDGKQPSHHAPPSNIETSSNPQSAQQLHTLTHRGLLVLKQPSLDPALHLLHGAFTLP